MASSESRKPGGSAPSPPEATSVAAGKRRFSRYPWKTTVQVLWLEDHVYGSSMPMRTMDLSAGGIALLSASWVHLHRFGAILLTNGPGQYSIRWVEVMHGRYVSEKKAHVIGCRWVPAPESAPTVRVVETTSGPRLEFETEPLSRP